MVGERPTTGSGADDDDVKMILLRQVRPLLVRYNFPHRHFSTYCRGAEVSHFFTVRRLSRSPGLPRSWVLARKK